MEFYKSPILANTPCKSTCQLTMHTKFAHTVEVLEKGAKTCQNAPQHAMCTDACNSAVYYAAPVSVHPKNSRRLQKVSLTLTKKNLSGSSRWGRRLVQWRPIGTGLPFPSAQNPRIQSISRFGRGEFCPEIFPCWNFLNPRKDIGNTHLENYWRKFRGVPRSPPLASPSCIVTPV